MYYMFATLATLYSALAVVLLITYFYMKRVHGIAFTQFLASDVVRHPLVQRIVNAYERHTKAQAAPGA